MNEKPEDRIEKIVADLLRGRRLKLRGGDADEKAAITAAARLAGMRHGPQRMSAAFRKRLERALEDAPAEAWITRRAALVAGLGLAAGAASGAYLARAFSPGTAPVALDYIEPMNARWVDVGAMDDLAEGQGKRIKAGAVSAYVFRQGYTVSAVSSVCSHLPCELSWEAPSAQLSCPCHPARFTPDGYPVGNYGLNPLNPVHVRVSPQGRVEVLGTE